MLEEQDTTVTGENRLSGRIPQPDFKVSALITDVTWDQFKDSFMGF